MRKEERRGMIWKEERGGGSIVISGGSLLRNGHAIGATFGDSKQRSVDISFFPCQELRYFSFGSFVFFMSLEL